jgi:hypothetical protein
MAITGSYSSIKIAGEFQDYCDLNLKGGHGQFYINKIQTM